MTQRGITIPSESGPENNSAEGLLHTPITLELEPQHRMELSLIPRILIF